MDRCGEVSGRGGVMVQHVNGILYTDQRVANSVLWVVAAFVILGGYNIMSSWRQNRVADVGKRLRKIIIPYVICTCVYVIWEEHFFSAERVWQRILHFNAAGPLYFVAVYIQLVVISPFLIGCINWADKKSRVFRHTFLLVSVLSVSYISIHYTDILNIGLGGGNIFSGFWLIFWYGGMVFSAEKREWGARRKKVFSAVLLSLCILWEYIFVFRDYNNIFRGKYGNMYHMTAQMTWWNALEAFLVVFLIKEGIELLEMKESRAIAIGLRPISYIGKMSLYIFLYHILFRDIYQMYFSCENIWAGRFMCFLFMTGGSILIYYFFQALKKIVVAMTEMAGVQRKTVK